MKYTTIFLLVTSLLAGCSSSDDSDSTDTLNDSASTLGDDSSMTDVSTTDNPDGAVIGSDVDTLPTDTNGDDTASGSETPASADASTDAEITAGTVVPGSGANADGVNQPGASLPLDQLRDELIIDLAAYPVEDLTEEVVLLGETIAAGAAPGTTLSAGSFTISVRNEDVATATEITQYDCPLGGTVTAEIGQLAISESEFSNNADFNSYQFDQCRIETDGEQLLDGGVQMLVNNVSASGGGFDNRDAQWANFSWQQGNGNVYEGTAVIDVDRLLSSDNQEARTVTIERFEHSTNGQIATRIVDGSMTLLMDSLGSGFIQKFQLDIAGQVTTEAGVAVQISTDSTFTASQTPAEAPDSAEAFTGVLSMVADDGGRLVMTAQPVTAFGPKLVDIEFTTNSGEVINLEGEVFPELSIISQ